MFDKKVEYQLPLDWLKKRPQLIPNLFSLILGLVLIVSGMVGLFSSYQSSGVQIIEAQVPELPPAQIYVDVSGAVVHPGIYQMEEGDRIAHALDRAGGALKAADIYFFAKNINLAQKIADQDKIYIPFAGENYQATGQDGLSDSPTASKTSSSELISINQSSQKELENLPGIGEVRAKAIIEGRPYGNVEDLVSRNILSVSLWEDIKELIEL